MNIGIHKIKLSDRLSENDNYIYQRSFEKALKNRDTFPFCFKRNSEIESWNQEPIENFNKLLKYVIKLRNDNEITDEILDELIKKVTSTFIEKEISMRVETEVSKQLNKVFNKKTSYDYLASIFYG